MSKPGGKSGNKSGDDQRGREKPDPDESVRPLPWFLTMGLGAMAMWGAFYIYTTPSGEDSAYGDQRSVATLRPPVAASGAVAKVDGKQVYARNCVACHQASGQGIAGVFPPLAGSEWVIGDEVVLTRILLHGVVGEMKVRGMVYNGAMPAWKTLTDEELAAVMSYIRTDWGNQAAAIEASTVKAQREATQGQTQPYTSEQLLKPAS